MTSVDARERTGPLAYWLLPPADRRAVRRIETTCRASGEQRLDAVALARLQRAVCRERLLGAVLHRRSTTRLSAGERLGRLCSTMRHPSRTGLCAGTAPSVSRPRTS